MIAKPGVQEKVLLHLLDYADFKEKVEVPFALSQMGELLMLSPLLDQMYRELFLD